MFVNYFFFVIALILFGNSLSEDGKPVIRVLAPQFICGAKNDSSSSAAISTPGITNIRIRTRAGQNLSLNWTVRFRVIDGPKGQRFTILLWRVVRKLEKTLNEMSPQIVESNNVAINSSALIEGVEYVFKVFGVSGDGEAGDPDTFGIKYADSKKDPTLHLKDTVSDEQFSVLMFGSDATYANTPYSVEAHVISCEATNDYFFEWKVIDTKSKSVLNVNEQLGKKLTIPAGRLVGGTNYDITVKIYHISAKRLITKSGIFVKALKKNLTVDLSCENMKIASGVPIAISASLNNPDNIQETTKFNWTCKKLSDSTDCENFPSSNTSELNLEGGFSEIGIYQIELNVVKGNSKANKVCEFNVDNAMLPTIDIGSSRKVVASNLPLEIQSQISDLRPGCTLQWSLINEDGFGTFDPNLLPDVFQRKLSINSLEETFLSEIVEFGNNTFSRNYPLIIPTAQGNWPGLEPEKMYKFRLTVHCVCTPSIQCEEPSDVTAFSDVTIHTNGPPVLETLTIKPSMGVALRTLFTFSTKSASDISSDYPLWYMFGIKIADNEILYINHFLDHVAVETILPYSDTPIVPILTVCDSRGACDSMEGDSILVDTPNTLLTVVEMDYYKDKFKSNLYRKEYKDAFYLANVVLRTLKGMEDEENYGNFSIYVESEVRSDIATQTAQSDKIDIVAANNLVQEATYFIQKFDTFSEDFLGDILKLRDILFEIVSQTSTARLEETSLRKKRNTLNVIAKSKPFSFDKDGLHKRPKRDVSFDDVKNFLKVSELIINTTKGDAKSKEKSKMLMNIVKSTPDLCRKSTKYANSLDSQIVSLSFDKFNLRSNLPTISLPYIPHIDAKFDLASIANMQFVNSEKLNGKPYCLAKYTFTTDILNPNGDENQRGFIYHASLYSDTVTGQFKEVSDMYPVMLKIPVQSKIPLKDSEIYECRLWLENVWLQGSCETNDKYETISSRVYVVCRCVNLGYISLYVTDSNPKEEIIYPEIVTTDIYITDTTTNLVTNEVLVEATTLSMFLTTSLGLESTTCNESKCQKHNQSGIIPAVVSVVVILLCITLVVFVIMKKRSKKKINNDDKIQLVKKNILKKSPKYKKFYAEHLMEGSSESLAKYNILQNVPEDD